MSDNIRNTIYENKMYRREVKEEFLSKYQGDSANPYKRIFLKSYMLESMWDKDLCDFSLPEIEQLLFALAPLTIGASKNNANLIDQYINWAIPNYTSRQTNVSPLENFKTNKEYLGKFIDKDIQLYISKQELDDIVDDCKNFQDKIIFVGLFLGINADQLCQMKKEDIKDGYVIIRDDEGSIKKDENNNPIAVELSEKEMVIFEGAAEEKFYHVYQNEGKRESRFETVELIDNDYVLRVGNTNSKSISEPVKKHVITRRVNVVREAIANPHITPNNIIRSGHIYEGFKLWDNAGRPDFEDGNLSTEMYQAICKKYHMKKVRMGNSLTYNTNALRNYINLETIREYYLESH